MKLVKVNIPSLYAPETHMSREEGNTKGDASFNIPLWFVSILKVSFPAILVGFGMYYRMGAMETAQTELHSTVTVLSAKLLEKSEKILMLEQKTENMKALDTLEKSATVKTLERIEGDIKMMQADVKDIRAKQATMMSVHGVKTN